MGAPLDEANIQGSTTFCYMCLYGGNILPIFRYLASTGSLYDFAESRLVLDDHISSTTDIERARFNVPGVCDVVRALPFINTPELSWKNVSWGWVNPELLLEMQQKEQVSHLLEFRTTPIDDMNRSMVKFLHVYFRHIHGQAQNLGLGETMPLTGWRRLCRYVFVGVSLRTLSQLSPGDTYRATSNICSTQTIRQPPFVSLREHRRLTSITVRSWLEDLLASGIDLEEYGKIEPLHLPCHVIGTCSSRWDNGKLSYKYCGLTICSLHYGARPQDWIFEWDFFYPEFAKEFWELVDPPPSPMPGSWIDDKY